MEFLDSDCGPAELSEQLIAAHKLHHKSKEAEACRHGSACDLVAAMQVRNTAGR
jgi:hypothetical protein